MDSERPQSIDSNMCFQHEEGGHEFYQQPQLLGIEEVDSSDFDDDEDDDEEGDGDLLEMSDEDKGMGDGDAGSNGGGDH